MRHLEIITQHNISVNWCTLWIGWKGPRTYPSLVETSDIINFARDHLLPEGSYSRQISRLSALYESDTDEVRELLSQLSNSEACEESFEARKWRFAILVELLEQLPEDPLSAVLELTEFWSNWGFPSDSPIADVNINEYYNKANLESLIKSHKIWLSNESKALCR